MKKCEALETLMAKGLFLEERPAGPAAAKASTKKYRFTSRAGH
jgi:hypothetical protein